MSTTTRTTAPFIWYELMTTDNAAAFKFYSHVLGWTAAQDPLATPEYTIANAGKFSVGGLMKLPAEMSAAGVPPCWMTYLGVDDVEATVAKVTAAGGSVRRAPSDIPGVGRFAVLADPHGAAFMILKPISSGPMPAIPDGTPGTIGWRELHAGDGTAACKWYAEQFGWKQVSEMDMGAMGFYRLFSTGGDQAEGGMMTKMAEAPAPFWTFYFNVEALDAAVERVNQGGGKVLMAQHQVPTGQWIAYIADPQGATFGLLAAKR
jgi:predicted enzyme related to lactoylglutathione lyase